MSHLDLCPLLIPVSDSTFSGFVDILGHSYKICLHIPKSSNFEDASIECEWKLQHQIQHKADVIVQRLRGASDLTAFLKEFISICESCLRSSTSEQTTWHDPLEILKQVQELGWEKVNNIGPNLCKLELVLLDDGGREHKLHVTLNNQDVASLPICSVDLPEKFSFHWSGKARLRHLYHQFETAVGAYQHFWNMMKEIDDNCWILEPEHPAFSINHRRIAIGPNMSLHIVVNCRQPDTLPECKLLGSESAVAELREKLNVNLHRWDIGRSLLKNLEEVLDVDFPSPATTNKEDLSIDCNICYCHQLEDEIPDIVCEEKRCGQPFHRSCLLEWLRSVSSRQSLNILFGDCPLCCHPIRVKLTAS